MAAGPEAPPSHGLQGTVSGAVRQQTIIKISLDSCAVSKPTEKHQWDSPKQAWEQNTWGYEQSSTLSRRR